MKNLIKKTFILALIAIGLYSCTADDHSNVGSVKGSIVLSSPSAAASYVLDPTNTSGIVFTAKWSAADFGYKAAVTYKLEVIKATDSFNPNYTEAAGITLGTYPEFSNSNYQLDIKTSDFNSALLAANGIINTALDYKIRIVAYPSTQTALTPNGIVTLSQEITVNVTPYDAFDTLPRLYVPGNYGAASTYADWSGAGNSARIFSKASNGNYEGFIWMNNPSPEFKFNSDPTWSGNDKGESSSDGSFTGILGTSHNIVAASGAGTYFFTVNWPALTYTMGIRQIAIIGAATPSGWGSPTYLTFNTDSTSPYYRMYTANLALTADEFLIRTKDDWSEKMGAAPGSGTTTVTSTQPNKLYFNGDNMKVPAAGNYIVVLDVRNSANYNLRLIPN